MTAQQGHRYRLGPVDVMALSSGLRPRVAAIYSGKFWPLGEPFEANAADLKPQPMAYFHGELPK